jgi:hypothetical protein
MAEPQESVSVSGNRVRPLTQEELTALTSELQAVLEKHGAEMGVTSTINLMKVIDEPKPESISDGEEKADSPSEEGS